VEKDRPPTGEERERRVRRGKCDAQRERESYNQILPPVKNERVDGEMRAGGEGRTAGRRRERERRVRRGNAMHREKERKRRRRVPFLASTDT
jgi:hypothetical protein